MPLIRKILKLTLMGFTYGSPNGQELILFRTYADSSKIYVDSYITCAGTVNFLPLTTLICLARKLL